MELSQRKHLRIGATMKIIKADITHLDNVYELLCELENKDLDKNEFIKIYQDNLNDSNIHYYLAVDELVIIGFASLHIQKLLHHCACIGEIQEIIITKNQQKSGAGTVLFNKVKETAIQNNCSELEVCCNNIRVNSHKFYLKQGMINSHYKFTYHLD